MFEFDDLDEVEEKTSSASQAPVEDHVAELSRLRKENEKLKQQLQDAGATISSGGKGFEPRDKADPLASWFPLKHTAAINTGGEGGYMICIGPPSVQACEWVEPELHVGSRGFRIQQEAMRQNVDLDDNVLVQGTVHRHQEMLVAQYPRGTNDIAVAGRDLANLLKHILSTKDWEIFAVGVGVWVACALLQELHDFSKGAWRKCACVHVIGFPRPDRGTARLPHGMSSEDESLSKSVKSEKPLVPKEIHVGHLIECAGQSRDLMKDWFDIVPQAGGTLPMVALAGNAGLLSNPIHRHDAFWVMSRLGMGTKVLKGYDDARLYRTVCIKDGLPIHPASLFDEQGDLRLQELKRNIDMKPFQKHLSSGTEPQAFCDSFPVGQCGAENGMDLRCWGDMSTEPCLQNKSGKGCKTVSLVRFSWRAQVGAAPSDSNTIHGGAIGAVMDETTAECMKFWIQPQTITRKIEHQIVKACLPYHTYKVECTVHEVKNEGVIYIVKGTMTDLAGELACKTTAEMVDMIAMKKFMAGNK